MQEMTLTYQQLVQAQRPLQALAAKDMPIKVAVSIALNIEGFRPFYQVYDDLLRKLYEEMGAEAGRQDYTPSDIPEDNRSLFNRKVDELLDTAVGVFVHTLSMEDLEGVQVKPLEILPLIFLFGQQGEQ